MSTSGVGFDGGRVGFGKQIPEGEGEGEQAHQAKQDAAPAEGAEAEVKETQRIGIGEGAAEGDAIERDGEPDVEAPDVARARVVAKDQRAGDGERGGEQPKDDPADEADDCEVHSPAPLSRGFFIGSRYGSPHPLAPSPCEERGEQRRVAAGLPAKNPASSRRSGSQYARP